MSALYEGWVRHRRSDQVEHEFRYPLFMAYLDLADLPGVLDPFRGWSARGRALAEFRRSDYLGDPSQSLDKAVRDAVAERSDQRPDGPIRLLTNLRYFGHCFNPVSFYYCFDPTGERVDQVLAEVTNTPWGERHSYMLGRQDESQNVITGELDKAFHVSPLMGMDHTYDWRTTEPSEDVIVHIASRTSPPAPAQGSEAEQAGVSGGGAPGPVFDATLSMRRRELSRSSTRRVLMRYPALSMQVMAKIYWQSLRLKLKGAPYYPHPERSAT